MEDGGRAVTAPAPHGPGGPGGLAGDTRPALSLADLEASDPRPAGGGDERRFCCPLPGCADKPRDRAHQSLCVNVASGLWLCNRCGARGKLTDRWQASPGYRRQAALRTFRLPPDPQRGAADSAPDLPRLWAATVPLAGTPGAVYLEARRGIPPAVAEAAGVRFARDWYGLPAVVFPCHDRAGELVAANGRYLAPRPGQPKTRTCGDLKLGAFATPGAWTHDPLVLVEGPVDALALAAAGLPAVALVEARPPVWLTERTFGRRVAVALDADATGDAAAAALLTKLRELGADAFRWRPPVVGGVKDWADLVQSGSGQAGSLPGLVAALLGRAESTPSSTPVPVTLRQARVDWEGAAPGTAAGELARRFYRLVRAAAIATDAGEDDDVGPFLDRVGVRPAALAERRSKGC